MPNTSSPQVKVANRLAELAERIVARNYMALTLQTYIEVGDKMEIVTVILPPSCAHDNLYTYGLDT